MKCICHCPKQSTAASSGFEFKLQFQIKGFLFTKIVCNVKSTIILFIVRLLFKPWRVEASVGRERAKLAIRTSAPPA